MVDVEKLRTVILIMAKIRKILVQIEASKLSCMIEK